MKVVILALLFITFGCDWTSKKPLKKISEEPIERGKELVQSYGCISCHKIPGMVGNPSDIGPTLEDWGNRKYIAGELPNRHEELTRWLMKPHAIDKKTTMPDLGLSQGEASAIASFLATLKDEAP